MRATLRWAAACVTAVVALFGSAHGGPVWRVDDDATIIGPDAFGYRAMDGVAFAFEDISITGMRVLAGLDDRFVSAPLGFSFSFYGTAYDRVYFSDNGLITFSEGTAASSNRDLSQHSSPGGEYSSSLPAIAALWDDWQFQYGSGPEPSDPQPDAAYCLLAGLPGERRFIVQWNRVFGFGGGLPYGSPSSVTFQAILFEGSHDILFQYLDVDSGDGGAWGGTATVAIANSNGHASGENLQWSFMQPSIGNELALLFTPNPLPGAFIGGDFNGDGVVDQSDLDLVLLNWGSTEIPDGWLAAEQVVGGHIDQMELDLVLLNWGATAPDELHASAGLKRTGSLTMTPEPSTVMLLGLGALTVIGSCRRSCRRWDRLKRRFGDPNATNSARVVICLAVGLLLGCQTGCSCKSSSRDNPWRRLSAAEIEEARKHQEERRARDEKEEAALRAKADKETKKKEEEHRKRLEAERLTREAQQREWKAKAEEKREAEPEKKTSFVLSAFLRRRATGWSLRQAAAGWARTACVVTAAPATADGP